jgi:hypothetical protein
MNQDEIMSTQMPPTIRNSSTSKEKKEKRRAKT